MRPLRLLYLGGGKDDVRPVEQELARNGWAVEWRRVETAEGFRDALHLTWDVIVSDDGVPRFGAREALGVLQASEQPDAPFIVVSGSIGQEAVVELLRLGADDLIHTGNRAALVAAIERELADSDGRRDRREAQRALAEALASREELIAIAGHEFRNPLAALLITIDSLHRSGRAPEHAQALSRQAGRLRDLVTRFVDIAALDAGSFELRISDVDLAAVTAREVRRIWAEPERIRLEAPLPVHIHADLGRLELVIASLLDNALKFGGREPVVVRVRWERDRGVVEVADRGPGLAEAERETVFRPFGKRVSSRHFGGFGLSLWLSRSILERHGGTLVATPNPGGGALFRMRIPAEPLNRSAPGSSPEGPPPPPASG